jgi:hypothetical protein
VGVEECGKMLSWETLKKLTGSKFAQNIVLVPFVGWLLIYQNTFAQMISQLFNFDPDISLSWEILLFYLGLVLLGVSAVAFRLLGPEAVLSHDGLQGYSEDTEAVLTRKEFTRLCAEIGCEVPEEVKVPASGTGQVLDGLLDQWKRLNSENIRDTLAKHYRSENSKGTAWRTFTSITFMVGALFTLVPTVTTVCWAIGQIITLFI